MLGLAGARHALRAAFNRSSMPSTLRPIPHSFTLQRRTNATLTSRSFPSLFESRTGPVRVLPFESGDTAAGIMAHMISPSEMMFRHASQRTAHPDLPAHDWQISVPDVEDKQVLMYKIDPTQDLVVLAVAPNDQTRHTCTLQLLSMSSGQPHPLAAASTLTVDVVDPFPEEISISGSSVGVMTSMTKNVQNLNVWNWKSGQVLLDVPADEHISFNLLDETHLLVGHRVKPRQEGRHSALTVITLEESGETFRHRTLMLPTLRNSRMSKINIVSQPTISAPHADRIISLQLDFYVNNNFFRRYGIRVVTMVSKLKALADADDAPSVRPWAAWAQHTRMFPPGYHEDDEPGGPYTYGTRFVIYDHLDTESEAAKTENADLPGELRIHAYPGAVKIFDFGVTPAECARAEQGGTAVLHWTHVSDGERKEGFSNVVEGDSYVVAPTTLPDYAQEFFEDADGAVATALPYRRRVRTLGPGFDRNYTGGERVPELAAPLNFYRPEILRQVFRFRSGTPRFEDQFEGRVVKAACPPPPRTFERRSHAGGRARVRRARGRRLAMMGRGKRRPGDFHVLRSSVVKEQRVKRSAARVALASGSDNVPPVKDIKVKENLGVEDWVRRRLKAFEKVAMTEDSLIFVRNCYKEKWWADESAGEEWLVLDLTDKGVI